ncbi:hypothetical protein [Okeania sp. SIO2B3]|uniref:hypothetical protein n=1 Tax=Okeania sp. SIO2B3 TaxID=2607784 RepID=UPI0013C13B00|nr:hypothetical protein [Okeania sp. SIO2B3]NET44861.1 hypothetical protein [Okeania sp. SIO2B3]
MAEVLVSAQIYKELAIEIYLRETRGEKLKNLEPQAMVRELKAAADYSVIASNIFSDANKE